jgi:hypothetical protein
VTALFHDRGHAGTELAKEIAKELKIDTTAVPPFKIEDIIVVAIS